MGKGFIEKRRAGPVNRLRRMLYGLLLGSASAPALAGSLQDAILNGAPQRLPRVQAGGAQWMHDNVLLARDPSGSGVYAYAGLGPALSGGLGRDFAFLPVGEALFTAHYLGSDLKKISRGLGVDLALPEFGYFHLNLYPGRNDMNGGKRWRVDPLGFDLPESSERVWSLGGSLALERDAPGEHRQLRFVPQLVLNLDTITHVSGRMQAVISYHNWRSQVDRGPTDTGPVPQITLKWWY